MPKTKKFQIRFYGCDAKDTKKLGIPHASVFDWVLAESKRQKAGQLPKVYSSDTGAMELRELFVGQNGQSIRGVLALLRDDAPHKRTTNGAETSLDLLEGENLIEKNHFLLLKHPALLVWQVNRKANHHTSMARLCEHLSGQQVSVALHDVLTQDAVSKLNGGTPRRFELKIKCPKTKAASRNPYDFGHSLEQMAAFAPDNYLTLEFSVGRGSGSLPQAMLDYAQKVAGKAFGLEVERARVKLAEYEQPIDLLADCVKDSMTVSMNGNYPASDSIYSELEKAKQRQKEHLDYFFAPPDILE